MRSTYNHGRQVRTGHYVGMKFEQGWFFVNVLETEQIDLKPFTLKNEDGERDEVAPRTAGITDDEITDDLGRKLITPADNEQELLFQTLMGVYPSRMHIYPVFGRDRRPNLRGGAEPGDAQTPLTGYDSPYNNPSLQGELFHVNQMEDLQLQAYNPMDEPAEARVSFKVTKFKYSVVEDVDLMRSFIDGQVTFRDHAMGLGARTTDQIRAPGWLLERFGDVILTTREIYEETEQVGNGDVIDAENAVPELNEG